MIANKLRGQHVESHSRGGFLSDFILGSQDGLVNVLGIMLGVSAATTDVRIIFVAALAALGAEAVSMGAVAYTSTLARRRYYLAEVEREKREMRDMPKAEEKEIDGILKKWGYKGKALQDMKKNIIANPKAMLEIMMSFELSLSPVSASQPTRSFVTVFSATIFGSIIPIIPFIFFTTDVAAGAIASVIASGIFLFIMGYYEAKYTLGSLWRSGLQMLVIGLAAGFVGYLIGHFIGAVTI